MQSKTIPQPLNRSENTIPGLSPEQIRDAQATAEKAIKVTNFKFSNICTSSLFYDRQWLFL
jgi:hypothetical protein